MIRKFILHFYGLLTFFLIGCGVPGLTLEMERPARFNIPSEIKKVFIDPNFFNTSKDQLSLKNHVLTSLRDELNRLGRFQVEISSPRNYDPNRETVAVVQGSIFSKAEMDQGQVTEKAGCVPRDLLQTLFRSGGLQADGRRGLTCLPISQVSSGMNQLINFATGANEEDVWVEEAVWTYTYRSYTYTLQVDLSFTTIGVDRNVLAIRSESSNYGIRLVNPNSAKVIEQASAPLTLTKSRAVLKNTKASSYVQWFQKVDQNRRGAPSKQDQQRIIKTLTQKTLSSFVQDISPYKVKVHTGIDTGGNEKAVRLLRKKQFLQAQELLINLKEKSAEDFYNLGLSYEAGARTVDDYRMAALYYGKALDEEPGEDLYIQGLGRVELRLMEAKQLAKQKS